MPRSAKTRFNSVLQNRHFIIMIPSKNDGVKTGSYRKTVDRRKKYHQPVQRRPPKRQEKRKGVSNHVAHTSVTLQETALPTKRLTPHRDYGTTNRALGKAVKRLIPAENRRDQERSLNKLASLYETRRLLV